MGHDMGKDEFCDTPAVITTPAEERPGLREGYATLLRLGWPTRYIDWRMCERAHAGCMERFTDVFRWAQCIRAWAVCDGDKEGIAGDLAATVES